jgi:hypothetical protein
MLLIEVVYDLFCVGGLSRTKLTKQVCTLFLTQVRKLVVGQSMGAAKWFDLTAQL